MKKANKPNAGIETIDTKENCQRYKVKYNNTKLDGKFYNEGDTVESTVELSTNYFDKF